MKADEGPHKICCGFVNPSLGKWGDYFEPEKTCRENVLNLAVPVAYESSGLWLNLTYKLRYPSILP